jgi:hypothetical protein
VPSLPAKPPDFRRRCSLYLKIGEQFLYLLQTIGPDDCVNAFHCYPPYLLVIGLCLKSVRWPEKNL